jgi:hypothetical protein
MSDSPEENAGQGGSRHARPPEPAPKRKRIIIFGAIAGVIVIVAAIAVITLSGTFTHHHDADAAQTPSAPTPKATPSSAPNNTPNTTTQASGTPSTGPDDVQLKADFDQLASTIGGPIGMSIAPVGGGGSPITLGKWTVGAAWSTSKIPLVIAALRAESPPAQITEAMKAAITNSDNAAAESIWGGLGNGDPVAAAHAVQQVLADAGDHETQVPSERKRSGYTIFGQTQWSLANQVNFAAVMACDDRDKPVLDLMSQIEPGQRWGLGVVPNAEFKGGWGPNEENRYLVRQFGFITNEATGAVTAVAIAVEPNSGSFDDGTADLSKIGKWLQDHMSKLPAGKCSH